MSKSSNIIAGIISGAALGLTIGVLYAPEKGNKTRKKIKKKAIDTKESLLEQKDVLIEKATELTNKLNDQVTNTFTSKKGEFEKDLDKIVTDMSYKADDVITALEQKLEKLKKENAKLN